LAGIVVTERECCEKKEKQMVDIFSKSIGRSPDEKMTTGNFS